MSAFIRSVQIGINQATVALSVHGCPSLSNQTILLLSPHPISNKLYGNLFNHIPQAKFEDSFENQKVKVTVVNIVNYKFQRNLVIFPMSYTLEWYIGPVGLKSNGTCVLF